MEIVRDAWGIPHVRARGVADAFFAQGFVHAQDRLWQMDRNRHLAYGRWAEYAGPEGLEQDRLLRRFRLEALARTGYEAAPPETRAMLDAFAAGVNASLAATDHLPLEYELLGVRPSPWQPWDGLAIYTYRHLFMGTHEEKLWRMRLLQRLGPSTLAALYPPAPEEERLILPTGRASALAPAAPLAALGAALSAAAWLPDEAGGSNSWVLAGQRTASGKPLLAGDPHRPIEVPNVYYQNHLACDEFDAIGLSFPGVPGFPHFGHNRWVAWCVTHAMADTQDLFVEEFDPGRPGRYRGVEDWEEAEVYRETLAVRGAPPVELDVVVTRHGPIVAGDPASGQAIAFRSPATSGEHHGWDCLLAMLRSRSCEELEESIRGWADPVNNFLFADVHGTISYRTRGMVPLRHPLNAWLPVPGWDGAHDWQGIVPFEQMPARRNPREGVIVTANNRITDVPSPYIGLFFAADHRARRIADLLESQASFSAEAMTAIHADVLSLPALRLLLLLETLTPRTEAGARAKAILQTWDGRVAADQVAPTIYNALRDELVGLVLQPRLGPLYAEAYVAGFAHVSRLRGRILDLMVADDRTLLPEGRTWRDLLAEGLERAVARVRHELGEDEAAWQWGRVHRSAPRHPLSQQFPQYAAHLDPPVVAMGGDGDTVQAAGYLPPDGFAVTLTSVARYVFDLADWDRSGWVVPLGASGLPGSPHYADQLERWAEHRLVPMLYSWDRIEAEAEGRQALRPPGDA